MRSHIFKVVPKSLNRSAVRFTKTLLPPSNASGVALPPSVEAKTRAFNSASLPPRVTHVVIKPQCENIRKTFNPSLASAFCSEWEK
jgi:hypothetical protein